LPFTTFTPFTKERKKTKKRKKILRLPYFVSEIYTNVLLLVGTFKPVVLGDVLTGGDRKW
jgi:hypothetical protein